MSIAQEGLLCKIVKLLSFQTQGWYVVSSKGDIFFGGKLVQLKILQTRFGVVSRGGIPVKIWVFP